MLGVAASRDRISLEKVALNWNESEYPDNSGRKIEMGLIDPDQPLALMTVFPVNELFLELKSFAPKIHISFSAGSYVCNNVYFKVLHYFPDKKSLFVHVPKLEIISFSEQCKIIETVLNFIAKKN